MVGRLRKRWRDRVVDLLDHALGRRLSRFGRRYQEFVLAWPYIDVKGLATAGDHTPELDEVYVDLSLAPRPPQHVPSDVLADVPPDVTQRHSIWEFLDRERSTVLAVIGAPGSGKTTLLRYVARRVARAGRGRRRTVPILLELRDHAGRVAADPGVTLPEVVRGTLRDLGGSEPPGWLEHCLRHGQCVVLLDGLDEVARAEDRRAVADWVEHQIRQYPNNHYVITSRPHGYQTAVIPGAEVLQVRPFTDEQVQRFLRGWYRAIERRSTGAEGRAVDLRADAAAEDLLDRLRTAPALYDLTVNPLLLTMIAHVHRYRGALPGGRADLYAEVCQVMLWRRQEAKKLPVELAGPNKERLLARLAFRMMRDQVRDLTQQRVLTEIRPGLRRMSKDLTAEDFLTGATSSGLLIEREHGLYAFAHHTFQEYLAAKHIRDNNLAQVLIEAVEDVWWRETTLLYVTGTDADPIVGSCLKAGTINALALAFDCAETSSELAPDLQDRLDQLLTAAFQDDANIEHRRLVAGVLAARHMRDFRSTQTGSRVCARPITTDLYWLFLQDTQASPPDGGCKPGTDAPVTGVWSSDAVAFVTWVNTITSGHGDTLCRLPTRDELEEPAIRTALMACAAPTSTLSAWTQSESEHTEPELWILAGGPDPHTVTRAQLVEAVTDDITGSPLIVQLVLLRSRVLARDFALALDRARDYDPAYPDFNLALDLARDLDLDLARDLDIACTRVLDRADGLGLGRGLDRALGLGLGLGRDLDRALDRALDLDLACARDLDLARDLALAMGPALASTLSLVLRQTEPLARGNRLQFISTFAQVLIDTATGPEIDQVTVPLNGALAAIVRTTRTVFEASSESRSVAVASRLTERATPIFERQRSLTAQDATAIRLAALSLVAPSDDRGPDTLGDAFRTIAAGITLLQKRANGQAPATETIILALT